MCQNPAEGSPIPFQAQPVGNSSCELGHLDLGVLGLAGFGGGRRSLWTGSFKVATGTGSLLLCYIPLHLPALHCIHLNGPAGL